MAKKKKEKKGGKRMKKKELVELIISYFRNKPGDTFTLKQLFQGLHLTTHPLKMLCVDTIEEMLEDNFLIETEKGRYRIMIRDRFLWESSSVRATERISLFPKMAVSLYLLLSVIRLMR